MLMVVAVFISNAAPRAGNIDPDEVLRYFSWARFAVIAVVYTAVVFWTELAKNGPFIFSNRNSRSKTQVIQAHLMFLIIIFFCLQIGVRVVPTMPFWMTDVHHLGRGTNGSILDFALVLLAYGMARLERHWLYRESDQTHPSSGYSISDTESE